MHCTSWELTASPLIASGKGKLSSQLPMGPAMAHFPGRISHFWGNPLLQRDAIMRFRLSSNMYFFPPWKVQNNKHKHQRNALREVKELYSSRYNSVLKWSNPTGRSSLASGIPGFSLKITGLYSSGTLRCITGLFLKAVKVLSEPMGYLDHWNGRNIVNSRGV